MGDIADDMIDRILSFGDWSRNDYGKKESCPYNHWRLKNGNFIPINEMETMHLFNSIKLIHNTLALAYSFPTIWYKGNANADLIDTLRIEGLSGNVSEYCFSKYQQLYVELKTRKDIPTHVSVAIEDMEGSLVDWWVNHSESIPVSPFIVVENIRETKAVWDIQVKASELPSIIWNVKGED